jgi:hypothetical protein
VDLGQVGRVFHHSLCLDHLGNSAGAAAASQEQEAKIWSISISTSAMALPRRPLLQRREQQQESP